MEHITATSYNVKFFFKMFFRNILYCIFCSIVMGVIGSFISITIIKDVISACLALFGIKYIYIDGMKSINSKFTLNEFEYEKLKIKLPPCNENGNLVISIQQNKRTEYDCRIGYGHC